MCIEEWARVITSDLRLDYDVIMFCEYALNEWSVSASLLEDQIGARQKGFHARTRAARVFNIFINFFRFTQSR